MYRVKLPPDGCHFDIEFLTQLPPGRVEIGLSGFELATRELPQTAVSFVEGPSADQKASVVLNDSGENANGGASQR